MNKAIVCFLVLSGVLLFGQVLGRNHAVSAQFETTAGEPGAFTLPPRAQIILKVNAPFDSKQFEFTISPCNGSLEWYVGPKGEVLDDDSQQKLFYFNSSPNNEYVLNSNYVASSNIVSVATFTLEDYQPGYYYVVVNNLEDDGIQFVYFFGTPQSSPFPVAGGDGNIDIFFPDATVAQLSWDPSPSEGVSYCIYAYPLSASNATTVHGSFCGLDTDYLLECTALTHFTVSNLTPGGTYIFDVLVTYDPDDEYSTFYFSTAYNGVVAYAQSTYDFYNGASSLAAFGAIIFAVVLSFF